MPVESWRPHKKNVIVESYLAWTLTPDSESPTDSYFTDYKSQTAPKGHKVQTDIKEKKNKTHKILCVVRSETMKKT